MAGLVQEAAVLQFLAEPLQRVERLVELHGHRHLGQVFADVVTEDIPQAHVCPGPTGSWQAAAARGPRSDPRNACPWTKAEHFSLPPDAGVADMLGPTAQGCLLTSGGIPAVALYGR